MEKELNRIISDSTSGSSDLLLKLSRLLRKYANHTTEIKKIISESEKHFSSFAVITNYTDVIKRAMRTNDPDSLKEVIAAPLRKGSLYREIFNNAYPIIKNVGSVFTFSNSRTILEVLKLLKERNKKLVVYITESRPKNEGRLLAKKLVQKGIKVKFGVDSAEADFIQQCDAVFCGADKILTDGSIVNKSGSLGAAVLCSYFKKPFYVFTETSKLSSKFKKEEKAHSEVWRFDAPGLYITNSYFEKVPAELITKIFTEKKKLEKR